MKTLYEGILADMETTIDSGETQSNEVFKKEYVSGFDVEFTNNAITLYSNDSTTDEWIEHAILQDIPGKQDIIIKNTKNIFLRSGVSDKTVSRLKYDSPITLRFADYWNIKNHKEAVLNNCTIEADCIYISYPIKFKNCKFILCTDNSTIRKVNTNLIMFYKESNLSSIKELSGLKFDSNNYNSCILNISHTNLGKEIYKNKDNKDYIEKLDKVLYNIFNDVIKRHRYCELVFDDDWSRYYHDVNKGWKTSYR